LFERNGEGAKPTAFADYIVSRAAPAMQSMEAIAREVRMMVRGEAGRLRIGMGPIIRDLIFADVSDRILQTFPRLSLRTFVASTPELQKELELHRIDVAINSSEHMPNEIDPEVEKDFVKTSLFSISLCFLARPDHPILLYKGPVSAETLLEFPIAGIGFTREQRTVFPSVLSPAQRKNLWAYQLSDYALVSRVVLNSDAIGCAPRPIFAEAIADGRLVSIPLAFRMEHHCVALTLPETWHSPTVRRFMTIAREVSDKIMLEAE
jgi:DNA-binding transcriptional LysR family regulator